MKKSRRLLYGGAMAVLFLALLCLAGCGNSQNASKLDPKNPVTVTAWHYYTGDQQAAFDTLAEEFNNTVGQQMGVHVQSVGKGSVNALADLLLEAVAGNAGAPEKPVLASVYAETAFILDQANALQPLDGYFSKEELAAYVPGFLSEGRFNAQDELLLFPVVKSTEMFTANATDWAVFAAATGVTLTDIKTKEGLTAAAKTYYEWSDALTPDVPEDGKALYGRDSVANYLYIGSYSLGHELFAVKNGKVTADLDRATFKTLWDNYYIPFINGYFGAYGRFRSDDCKTGKILGMTVSSSGVSYLPTAVTRPDDTLYEIDTYIARDLPFAGATVDAVVQQGASYCLLKSTPAQQEGAVVFLKWLTESERNLAFALMSAYNPVTLAANTTDAIAAAYGGDVSQPKDRNVLRALTVSAEAFASADCYAAKPFQGNKEVRTALGDALEQIAAADRAAVLLAMQAGQTREQAVAPYVTDAYFDQWFDALVKKVHEALQS